MLYVAPVVAWILGLALPAERPGFALALRGRYPGPEPVETPPTPPRSIPSAASPTRSPLRILRGATVHDTATRTPEPSASAAAFGDNDWDEQVLIDLEDLNATLERLAVAVNPPAELYGAALSACSHAAEWKGAVNLLQTMENWGLEVDGSHYTQVIRACSRAGEWERAQSLLLRARVEGRKLNRFGYSHVVDACERANQTEVAMHVYGLGVQDGAISHWLEEEPFALELHGFSEHMAACAVRYVLRYELGNYIQQDLKIVTGRGKHSRDEPKVLQRVERLLSEELEPPLPFAMERRLECSSRDCWLNVNAGCIVVEMKDLFEWLLETRSFESYVVKIPAEGVATDMAAEGCSPD